MAWKTEKNDLFKCELPADWRSKTLADGSPGFFFTDGAHSIRAARLSVDAKTRAAAIKTERALVEASTIPVAGQTSSLFRRQFKSETAGDERRGPAEWIYEETVVVPNKAGSWELMYRSGARTRQAAPSAGDAWRRFLKSFKPS